MSKSLVVTGASSGVGKALTIALASRGKKVLAVARDMVSLQQLKKHNPEFIDIVNADISTCSGRSEVAQRLKKGEKIFALVNNAGIMTPAGYLCDVDLREWQDQIAVNVEAPLFLTKELLPFLHKGRILNITTYSSSNVVIGLGSYGVSKAALNMITTYLRVELKKYKIAVGDVLPGIVDTNIQHQLPTCSEITLKNTINQMRNKSKLLSVEVVANFLMWLLLDTCDAMFSAKTWDIYDTKHHKYWASNFVIPQIQKEKLTE